MTSSAPPDSELASFASRDGGSASFVLGAVMASFASPDGGLASFDSRVIGLASFHFPAA